MNLESIPVGSNVFLVFLNGESPMSALVKTLKARASAIKKPVSASKLAEMAGLKHHSVLHAIQRGSIKAKAASSVTLASGKQRPLDYRISAREARRFIMKRADRLAAKVAS